MFRKSFQDKFFSILYSCGSSPLEIWGMHVKNGYVRRVTDEEVKTLTIELSGLNVATTYIYCPSDPRKNLGIILPFLIMIIKNMRKYFTFEITIRDDQNMNRRFRFSNFQSTTRVKTFYTSCPIALTTSPNGSWNQIQFNLSDLTRRAYGTNYVETTKMQIHANCRIRRIYFADKLYSPENIPNEYKLLLPLTSKVCIRQTKDRKPSLKEEVPLTKVPDFEAADDHAEMVKETNAVPSEIVMDEQEIEEVSLDVTEEDDQDYNYEQEKQIDKTEIKNEVEEEIEDEDHEDHENDKNNEDEEGKKVDEEQEELVKEDAGSEEGEAELLDTS